MNSKTSQAAGTGALPSTARSLPIALIRAREGVMLPIRDMLSDTGITEQQWRVLRVLSEFGPLDTKTLADRASLLFPSLTRIANTLKEKGLVTQTRDKADRRRQFVEITLAGQKLIDDHSDQAARIVDRFKATLGAENYEQLLDLLARLDPDNPG
ncbi:homoprotocatechuate degradation operon regulator HpaR [Pacificoceanicola onchidii]|uniref:homoprotocatechuate degradation operon regulator HpaR n=1 Tax=Pacificoceanicola onchidii TaxID=2562685 RepID=UPI00145626BB|nr:homoprotocatechuate degradation operon regulator HpaR [Pacificoceanicola onchidii]